VQDISADRVVENSWVKNYKVVMGRWIGLATFKGLSESEVYRLKDGKRCKIMSTIYIYGQMTGFHTCFVRWNRRRSSGM
jgi:hypothetical protein